MKVITILATSVLASGYWLGKQAADALKCPAPKVITIVAPLVAKPDHKVYESEHSSIACKKKKKRKKC